MKTLKDALIELSKEGERKREAEILKSFSEVYDALASLPLTSNDSIRCATESTSGE